MKGAPLEDVLQNAPRYDFIGADKRLSKAASEFDDVGREHILEYALKPVAGYDYCIIDTPPSMEILTLNALTAADEVVICCQSDGFSVAGLAGMKHNIEGVQKWYNSRLKVGGILMTRYNPRTMIAKQLAEIFREAAETMNAKVFQNYIRENTAIREAQVMKQDIYTYKPTSHGAEDYAAFVREYLGMKSNGKNLISIASACWMTSIRRRQHMKKRRPMFNWMKTATLSSAVVAAKEMLPAYRHTSVRHSTKCWMRWPVTITKH